MQEDPQQKISHKGTELTHVIEFTFNVSSISGTRHKTEVRVYHSAVDATSLRNCGVRLRLFAVDHQNKATEIDDVSIHHNHDGWVIFDSIRHTWEMEQKLAIAAVTSGTCPSDDSLSKLGFKVNKDNKNKQPMLVVFTSQERLMTEVKLAPSTIVDELLEDSNTQQKRQTDTGRCRLQSYQVRSNNVTL